MNFTLTGHISTVVTSVRQFLDLSQPDKVSTTFRTFFRVPDEDLPVGYCLVWGFD